MSRPLYQLKAEFFKTLGHPARRSVLTLWRKIRTTGRVADPAPSRPDGDVPAAAAGLRGSVQIRHVDAGSCNGCEVRARLEGRAGAGIGQPWRDLRKLMGKEPITPRGTSELFRMTPLLLVATSLVVAVVVPFVTTASAIGPAAGLSFPAGRFEREMRDPVRHRPGQPSAATSAGTALPLAQRLVPDARRRPRPARVRRRRRAVSI